MTASDNVGCAWQVRARVFCRAAELHQDCGFRDQLAGVGANDVDAEHTIRRGVGENFDEAVGHVNGLGAAVGGEREFADVVGDACGFKFFLGLADARHFRAV